MVARDLLDLMRPAKVDPATQKGRILAALRAAGRRGICLHDLERDDAYTARNRISELRKDGHRIESWPCGFHHHRSSVARYRLTEETGR